MDTSFYALLHFVFVLFSGNDAWAFFMNMAPTENYLCAVPELAFHDAHKTPSDFHNGF